MNSTINTNATAADMDTLSPRELRRAIEDYSDSVRLEGVDEQPDTSDLEIDISKRMVRTAGKVAHRNGEVKYVRYSYNAYKEWGWEEFKSTIRHELIHVWQVQQFGTGGHDRRFKRIARQNDTTVNCEKFTDAPYTLLCSECDGLVAHRYQRSKTVKHPERYNSGCCKANLEVEDNR